VAWGFLKCAKVIAAAGVQIAVHKTAVLTEIIETRFFSVLQTNMGILFRIWLRPFCTTSLSVRLFSNWRISWRHRASVGFVQGAKEQSDGIICQVRVISEVSYVTTIK